MNIREAKKVLKRLSEKDDQAKEAIQRIFIRWEEEIREKDIWIDAYANLLDRKKELEKQVRELEGALILRDQHQRNKNIFYRDFCMLDQSIRLTDSVTGEVYIKVKSKGDD